MKRIYEIAIFDGGLKNWRVLNLSTLTFYCLDYDTKEEAEAAIEAGEVRCGEIVTAVSHQDAVNALNNYYTM